MPSKKKIEQVKNLVQKLKEAKSVVLLDYKGLTHQQLAELRTKLREVGSFFSVTKNTLLELALKAQTGLPRAPQKAELLCGALRGPTATLFIKNDPLPPLKALNQFLNEFGLPKIKIGILEGEIVSRERVSQLATLPSREALTAQVVWSLKFPSQRLALSLTWNLQKLTQILKSRCT